MKYLRKYNESVSADDIIEDCKQILLDISDDYVKYNIEYLFFNSPPNRRICLTIGDYSSGESFDPGYYVETLDHLNTYLNSNGYRYYSNGTYYTTWEKRVEAILQFKGTPYGKLTLMEIYWSKV